LAAFVAKLQGMIEEMDRDRINKMGDLNVRFDKTEESYFVGLFHCLASPGEWKYS
jgi:hypothetical protein